MTERATVKTCPDALGRTITIGSTIAVPITYAQSMGYAVVEEIFLENDRGQRYLFHELVSLEATGEKRYMCWNKVGDVSEIGVDYTTHPCGDQDISRVTQSYALRARQIWPPAMWGGSEKSVTYSMPQNILRVEPTEVQAYMQQKHLLNQTPEKD